MHRSYLAQAEAHKKLARTSNPRRRLLHLELARCYLALADLARKNAATDLVYETPPRPSRTGQRQQPIEPKDNR